ncbi:OmpA/MotB domain protein [Rhodobacter ferrooxidans]|uniref:OmpA/MotB domain protein n=2 Tax=Rhodobacter ferrooxidans TaxID=371731 RepID=C8RX42_9RHOB|nr:OmpA/MotB domain protein [Rhodobacter sp. SW2]
MGVGMAGQSNARPIIIKRKKIIKGGGHHGGAWKVAYADFVTAMMAFFLLMWILGATTEKQRKGVADYFSPTIPINRVSGGGEGMFGGDSVFSEQTMPQSGTGASDRSPTEQNQARGENADAEAQAAAQIASVEKALTALGGESMTMEAALRHVVTKVTDEGLVIEIFDLQEAPLFAEGTDDPQPVLRDIAKMLAEVLGLASNSVAVNGYVKAYPIMMIDNPVWDLSAARAQAMRDLIQTAGLPANRVQRISGYADHKPVTADPTAIRNNRVEVILLRRDR